MSPQVVATPSTEITPQRQPAHASVFGTIDFSQFLSNGLMSLDQASNNNSAPQAPANPPKTENSDSDNANANLAGAAAVTASQQPAPTQGATQPAAQSTAPSVVAATAATLNPALVAAAASQASSSGNSSANSNSSQNAQTTLGAAGVQARVAAGAPNYLSQPNTMLAGLWHHGAAAAQASDAARGSDGTSGDDSASGASSTTADTQAAKPTTTALSDAAGQDIHSADEVATGSHASDALPGQAVAVAATTDATGGAIPAASVAAHAVPTTTPAVPTNAATTTSLPMPIHILPAAEQVAISLRQAAQSGTGRIEIQLKPASLGAIAVKLDVTHDGHISAVISADRSDTLNLLKQDSSGLQQALRDAGLKADSGSLSFNLRGGDSQSYFQNAAPGTTSQRYADAGAMPSTTQSGTPSYTRRHDGSLDIEV